MAQYDGSIRINTEINAKNAESQLSSLENRMKKTADKIASLRSKMESIKDAKIPTKEYESAAKEVEKLEKSLEDALTRKERFLEIGGKESSRTFKGMEYDIEGIKRKLEEAEQEVQILVDSGKAFTLGSDTEKYAKLGQELKNAENEMEVLSQKHDAQSLKVEKAESEYKRLGNTAENSLKKIASVIKNSTITSMKMLGNITKKVGSSLKGIASKLLNIGKSAKSTSVGINGMGTSFRNMLKYALGFESLYTLISKIKTAIKDGMGNLAQYSKPVNASLSSLKSALTQLKNSLATAFAPILNAAAPALTALINLASKAATAVGMLIAALTGQKSFVKAKEVQEDYAESLKNTSNAAKKAVKALAPFDKLNVLGKNDSDSSDKGGNGGVNIDDMFETVDIPSQISNLAEMIKKAWEDADFTELGGIIGQKLKNALEDIPWEKIQETAEKVGKSLATLINGFVETSGLGTMIGKTIAEAINTGLGLFESFAANLHWDSVGKFIADGINGALKNIDWETALSAASLFGEGLATLLNNLISPELFDALGETVANSLNTALHFLDSFGDTFDWKKFGKSIAESINRFFASFDWELAADTFNTLAGGILDAVIEAVKGIDWEQVRDKIVEFINGLDFKGIFFKLGKLANALANALYTLVSDKKTWKTLGKKIADGINGFFKGMNKVDKNTGLNGWQALGKSISDTITGIADMLIEAMNDVDWKAVGQAIADFIGSIDWEEIAWKVDGILDSLSKAIADAIEGATGIEVSVDAVNIVLKFGLLNWAFKALTDTSILSTIAGAVKGMLKSAGLLSSSGALTVSLAGISNFLVQIGAALSLSFPSPAVDDIVVRIEKWFTDKVWKPLCRKVSWLDENSEAGVFQIILTPIMSILGGLGNWFKDLWEDTTAVTDAIDVGNEVANGILRGIADALVLPAMFVYNLLIKPITDALGIHSPSTVARDEVGKNIGLGILGGIKLIKDKIVETAKNIWSFIKSPFLKAGKWFGDKFDGAYQKITGAFSGVSTFFTGVWSNIKGAFGNIVSWFRNKFSTAWEAVKKVFSTGGKVFTGIKDGILSGLKAVINGLISGINKVIKIPFDGINTALNKLKSISIVGQKPFGFLPTISVPQIPELANGAVIRGGDPFMAVLGDQPKGQTNIEAPLDTIRRANKDAVLEVLSELGVTAGSSRNYGNEKFVFQVDGKTFFEITRGEAQQYFRRTGRSPFPI